jgi:hypothetical protein
MIFSDWLRRTNEIMVKNYSVTLADLGAHDDERLRTAWKEGDTPLEFVAWFGEKYDLTHEDEWRCVVKPTE